jgi:hypothetical protein
MVRPTLAASDAALVAPGHALVFINRITANTNTPVREFWLANTFVLFPRQSARTASPTRSTPPPATSAACATCSA